MTKILARAVLLVSILGAAACVPPADRARVPVEPVEPPVAVSTAIGLRLVPPEQWPEIKDQLDAKSLVKAASNTLTYLDGLKGRKEFYRIGDREIAVGALIATVEGLVDVVKTSTSPEEMNRRLKEEFDLYQSVGSDGKGRVVFSSYYQPVLPASLKKTDKYKYPLYRKPEDMLEADLGAFNPKFKGETVLGRVKGKEFVPYFNRRDIDIRNVLAGRGYEVAWLANQFDRLDLHIQGSGILELTDGRTMLAKFAATNGLPYKSVGAAVLATGAMTKAEMSHERLRQYLTSHPEGEAWLIATNPRYTFFDVVDLPPDGEPFGTIQQPLTAGRSIAIDQKVIPLGAVAYYETNMPQADRKGKLLGIFPSSRLAMCQDTGGAILGPGRVDIYVGHGAQAKTTAVNQWSEGRLYVLLKKVPARDR